MLLEVKNLTKKFGELKAISNLSLSVEDGSITSLVGPNGAGKTTLFNVISGIYSPTSGSIIFNGKNITGYKPHKVASMGIGRTFQIPRLYNDMTVLENVVSGVLFGRGNVNKVRDAEEKAMRILELVRLERKKDKLARNLLASEKKFLEVARALAIKPKLLLVDECFGGLNETEAKEATHILTRIRDEWGVTVFMIEHVMRAVMTIAEKVVVIHHGSKIAEGKPKEIAEDPIVKDAYFG